MQIRDGAVVSSVAPIESADKSSGDSKVVEEVVEEATKPREGEMICFPMLFRILPSVLRLWISGISEFINLFLVFICNV
jgi:hypothetical protein